MIRKIIIALAVCVYLMVPASYADRSLKFITIEVAPWASIGAENSQPSGFFPELVAEIEQRSGYSIDITLSAFARVDRELESGRQDCTILVERDKQIVQHGALVAYHAMGVIARRGVTLNSYEDLAPLAISVLRGASIAPRFDIDNTLDKQFDTDYLIGLRKIEHDRLDAIAGAIPTIRFLAQRHNLSKYLGQELMLADVPLVLQCSKRSANLKVMPALNHAIQSMKSDGTLDALKSKFHF